MNAFQKAVREELQFARKKYPKPFVDAAHGYAKILEEVDEYWDECRVRDAEQDKLKMLKELVQISAMAQRTAEDLGLIDDSPNV